MPLAPVNPTMSLRIEGNHTPTPPVSEMRVTGHAGARKLQAANFGGVRNRWYLMLVPIRTSAVW
jgi:hypothetical protein